MDVSMRMPDLATTDSPIKVVRWLADVGATVRRGEPLLEVETDKATMEVESVVSGVLRSLVAAAGADVLAGEVIAVFEAEGAGAAAVESPGVADAAPAVHIQEPARSPIPPQHTSAVPAGRVSLFARNRAARDARAAPEAVTLSVARRALARRMSESQREVPHFYLQASADAGPAAARRASAAAAGRPIAWDALFVHAAGRALARFPRMGYRFDDDRIVPRATVAVNVAVDLDDELFAVGVEQPAERTPEEITDTLRTGVARLRAGDGRARVTPAAALTVSNLGATGVEAFAAVINPPETAVLAVAAVRPVVVAVDGRPAVQNRVTLTLSADHRVVNGKYAAAFLAAVVAAFEAPAPGEGARS
jgi:pyruvate dehydrogenase E2 component (dihydrolipoamide acetyltransferase)